MKLKKTSKIKPKTRTPIRAKRTTRFVELKNVSAAKRGHAMCVSLSPSPRSRSALQDSGSNAEKRLYDQRREDDNPRPRVKISQERVFQIAEVRLLNFPDDDFAGP